MQRTVEWYLSKGLDRKTAEYYAGGRRRIVSVSPNEDFSLTLIFDNGEVRRLDCRSFLRQGTVFEPFMQYDNFRRVYLDDTHAVSWDIDPNIDSDLVWSNKVDICPDTTYLDSTPEGK